MGQAFGCIQVKESTVAVKEICGKYKGVLDPGCHCLPWCLGHQVAGKVSLRVQQLDVRCEAKTQDNTSVNVVASIQYRVMAGKDKAYDAFYKLTNAKGQIQAYVSDVIRASLRTMDLNSDFEKKNDIAKAVEDKLKEAMSAYGFEIVQTLIVEFEKRDKSDTNAAARKRTAENKKAEAEKSSQIKQAEGEAEAEKILQIKRAEGEAETKYLLGLGIARQCQAIVDGLRDSVLAFTENVPGTSAKDVMHMVLVLSTSTPHGPGAVRDVAAQIREGLPQGASVEHESL